MTYICSKCGKEKSTSKNKQPNPDTGKMLCQKCSCKYTNSRKSKREKNSTTIKTRYDNGELEHMKEISRKNRIEFNKTTQRKYSLRNLQNKKLYMENNNGNS